MSGVRLYEWKHWAERLSSPWQFIPRDLEGVALPNPPRFRLGWVIDERQLAFEVEVDEPPMADSRAMTGQFQANLWQQDVAELFIRAAESSRYLELNLSPFGAWWACLFTGYRTADPEFMRPSVETDFSVEDHSWTAFLKIEIAYLERHLDFVPESAANVCFILGDTSRQYISASPLAEGKPDFHRCEYFEPMRRG